MTKVEQKESRFGKKQTAMLKGLLALSVIFHHLSQQTNTMWIFEIFKELGGQLVSAFFFISGYGLLASILSNKNYLDSFLKKRLLKVVVPFPLAIFAFLLSRLIDGDDLTFSGVFVPLLHGDTNHLLPYSWYVFVLIFFYLLFFISFRKISDLRDSLILILLFSILLIFVLKTFSFDGWWYQSTFGFFAGVLCKKTEKNIYALMKETKYRLSIFVIVLALIKLFGRDHFVSYGLYPCLIYLMFIHVKIPILKPLVRMGNISYEIYLLQGIAITLLRGNNLFLTNDYVYIATCVLVTIPLAALFHILLKKIFKTVLPDQKEIPINCS